MNYLLPPLEYPLPWDLDLLLIPTDEEGLDRKSGKLSSSSEDSRRRF
jgi:hypothetical protein